MSEESLQGSWVVTRYLSGDELISPVAEAVLTIDDDQVAGTMGVNRFVGRLGKGLPIGPMAVTRMAGPVEAMAQEDTLLGHLQKADQIEVDKSGMRMSHEGLTTVEFNRSGRPRGV